MSQANKGGGPIFRRNIMICIFKKIQLLNFKCISLFLQKIMKKVHFCYLMQQLVVNLFMDDSHVFFFIMYGLKFSLHPYTSQYLWTSFHDLPLGVSHHCSISRDQTIFSSNINCLTLADRDVQVFHGCSPQSQFYLLTQKYIFSSNK